MAAVKRLIIHHHSADCFLVLWDHEFILVMLEGMAGVAHFITGHEQAQ